MHLTLKGVSPKNLIDQLNQLKAPAHVEKSPELVESDSDDQVYSDKKWREKLQYECDNEFESNLGKYEVKF